MSDKQPMPDAARCAPPERTAPGTWHWLRDRDGIPRRIEWSGGAFGGVIPEKLRGYEYVRPARFEFYEEELEADVIALREENARLRAANHDLSQQQERLHMRLDELETALKWRPIESAPDDGTTVLL